MERHMDCTNSDLVYIGFVSVMLEFDYFHYCLFTPGLAHINPEAIRESVPYSYIQLATLT